MRKVLIGCVAVVCVILLASAVFAGEQGAKADSEGNYWAPWFKPSVSVGYAFDASQPHFTFTTRGIDLGGVTKMDIKPPRLSGIYLAGELPVQVTCRLKLALEGSWTMSLTNQDMNEVYNIVVARRIWDLDNNSDAVSLAFLASYAFLKDLSFVKDVSAVAGMRWDYHTMRFDEPTAIVITSAPSDTQHLSMHTLEPVFGLTGTFKGYKSGIFGGDMKLGFLAGPIVWGHVNYKERFGSTAIFHSDDDLNSGYLVKVFGEITALSGKISPAIDGSLSIFAQYTRSSISGTPDLTQVGVGTTGFNFDTESDVVAIGLKAAITF
jgi:hypothetical protein